MTTPPPVPRGLLPAAAVLGVGLGGFFDGILLHQVLQWHHLLSLVPGEALRDIGNQILADGLFHVLMYAITAAGLWMLWRRRAALREPGASARVLGGALLGFGGWNIADVGLFHWIMGIHRIRVDVSDPLAWDIGWLVIFGLAVTAAGLPGRQTRSRDRRRRTRRRRDPVPARARRRAARRPCQFPAARARWCCSPPARPPGPQSTRCSPRTAASCGSTRPAA
jgi:uncharacterized membrane protein